MAQTNYTPISLYYSTTASAVPTAANLVPGELAINTNDGKLYYEDSSGVVQVLASKATSSGVFGAISATSITNSGLTTGRVVYTTTGGLETSSANLLYSGTDLTVYGVRVGRGAGANANSTVVGSGALATNSTGGNITAIGYNALNLNTVGYNTAVGSNALATNSTGVGNAAFGSTSLLSNTTGSSNSAFGTFNEVSGVYGALFSNTTGSNNVAMGNGALFSNDTASNNTAVGYQAGTGITTGSSNTYIGYAATQSGVAVTNEIVVGASITGKGSNTAFIGGTSGAYNGANLATWSITSDERIKKNVISLESGLHIISALRPVEFDYIKDDKHDLGFIAQEYQKVLPSQVVEGADGMLSLNQNLVPYLVKAIQELQAQINELKGA